MRKILLISALTVNLLIASAQAQGFDVMGGSDGAQTMHHCGYLPTSGHDYIRDPLVTRILQKKLSRLGYYHGPIDGKFGKGSAAAMKIFQTEYALPRTGMADSASVSMLAYATHPSSNVGRCYRTASNYFR